MKRVAEKVKDIIEVRSFTQLNDFAADAGSTLTGYHFTDITADLMGKWIDAVAGVRPGHGTALALAGFRGVGKSHFLAVVGAIISNPELRARITDEHVATSADRLSRRHAPVAFVRRGSGISLLDELKSAIADVLKVDSSTLSDSLDDLLSMAADNAGELPFVLLIDTAFGRDSRVARDDGLLLSEIALAAKIHGFFTGVVLDDDISGADGPNSSIASNFSIDYLDQEHLYKIVDTYIFAKHTTMRPLLHDIYEHYRSSLPGFRWSELRFASLYPLHPAMVEISPLIRLYVHDFALLGFASEAGVKIMGRPANSLIGLDEVFDAVETKLRAAPDLKDAFAAFDKLDIDVIAGEPVQLRLPARLILKGLLMLSLNGQGSSAAEIAASMMIVEQDGSGSSAIDVEKLLASFAELMPNSIEMTAKDGSNTKYRFLLAAKNEIDQRLADAAADVPDDVVWDILLRQTADKFSDFDKSSEFGASPTNCKVEWRGGVRRGQIIWMALDGDDGNDLDWTVVVEQESRSQAVNVTSETRLTAMWRIAEPTADELDSIRKYHLLQTDAGIRESHGDSIATAVHIHSIAVEKIWQRLFLQDALLIADDVEYHFSDETGAMHSLAELFTGTLLPVFESRYSTHPQFSQTLDTRQAARLIADFFGGSAATGADAQKLAEAFAVPLGLAIKHGDALVPAGRDVLAGLETVKTAFGDFGTGSDTLIPLSEIFSRLQAPPVGLTREAINLILAALVAQRLFEFVTSSGNRINHRSLDLQIIWDDIVGVAKPISDLYPAERLLEWARLVTGNSGVRSLERSEDEQAIIDLLSAWLSGWKNDRILDEFDALPDENLNAAVWKIAASLRRSFGALADVIDSMLKNEMSLDQCLHSIAELFSDSEAEFEKKKSDLIMLKNFTADGSRLYKMVKYLSLAATTDVAEIESLRQSLLDSKFDRQSGAGYDFSKLEDSWMQFKHLYSNHYAERHDAAMNSAASELEFKEVLNSDRWSAFESLSKLPWFDKSSVSKAKSLIRKLRQLSCGSNVRVMLEVEPFCSCSFDFSESERPNDLANNLRSTINDGLESFGARLSEGKERLGFSSGESAGRAEAAVTRIIAGIADGDFSTIEIADIHLLKTTLAPIFEILSDSGIAETPAGENFRDFIPMDTHVVRNGLEGVS